MTSQQRGDEADQEILQRGGGVKRQRAPKSYGRNIWQRPPTKEGGMRTMTAIAHVSFIRLRAAAAAANDDEGESSW